MDYSLTFLAAAVASLIRPQTGLLDMFFPMVQQSEAPEIKFDTLDGKRRISPFVSPLIAGKLVTSKGKKTNTFTPAYVKDKRVLRPKDALKRAAGEKIGGSMTNNDRRMLLLRQEITDQTEMLSRRQEVMASEVLRTGKVTVTGEGFDTVVVDFGRNAAHTVTLSGAARWGQVGIVPLRDVEDWSLTMLQNSGAVVTDVVMDTKAYRLFIADQDTKDAIDTTLGAPSRVELAAMAKLGMSYKGQIDNVSYWVYSDWYVNDADTEVPMIPDNTVILGSRDMEGVRHFGAIEDEEAGLQSQEYFTKSWVQKDPSLRVLLMQSAPLVVPYRPDASFCATVN
jgi:hypothetical protein